MRSKPGDVKTPELSMSSWKNAKEALEKGSLTGWGQTLNVVEKKNWFGLSYQHLYKKLIEMIKESCAVPKRSLVVLDLDQTTR